MSLLKSFSIYTISGIISRGIAFLLLPYFTHHLTQADYGVITIFANSIYFITPFLNMGIGDTFTVEYPGLSKEELRRFISTSLFFPVIIFLISLLLILFAGDLFTRVTGLSTYLLYLVCILSVFNFLVEYLFTLFRNRNQAFYYAMLSIGKTLVELLFAVYLIGFLHQGYMGRVNSILISSAAGFVLVMIYFYKKGFLNLEFSKKWLKIILHRGLPAIPFFFLIFILNNSDKYFINYYKGQSSLGVYGLASQVAMIINLLAGSFVIPFYPFFYQNLVKKEYTRIGKVIAVYVVIMTATVLILDLTAPFFFRVFISAKFEAATGYIFLLSLGQLCWGMFLIFLGYLYFMKENKKLYYISAIAIIFTFIADYLIIKKSDSINWAWANMLSYLFCLLIIIFIYRKRITGVFNYLKLKHRSRTTIKE